MAFEFTDENFEAEVENSEGLVVVDFWATWCPPCVALGPTIEGLAADNPDVKIGKLDVQENVKISEKYEITSIPAILFFKNGVLVKQLLGVQKKSVLQAVIDSYEEVEEETTEVQEEGRGEAKEE